MSLKGLRFTLEVDGQEPDTFAVVNFRLIQNQSYPFVMSVDVASDSFMQTAEMLLEKNATLTIWQGVIPLRYVTGVVAGFGMQENNGWQMRYHLRIEPPLWRCGLRQNFRIFQQQDIRTISATLLNENGVTEWTPLFYEDHPAREFCVKYGEPDLALLARRGAVAGACCCGGCWVGSAVAKRAGGVRGSGGLLGGGAGGMRPGGGGVAGVGG
ncbi:contractile injection system protein, VgrG/Pvc8 family, partial [Escherichia coli]|uniref:contractile injection system protein, VgrG/Pvc8 family n=1 Tax=Escherichia coli TaxID=562 RepID=UPI00207B4C4C